MNPRQGIRSKIGSAFILQAAAISCATILGVYAAAMVLKDGLIKRALREESAHYIERLHRDRSAELPDTYNMRGFLAKPDSTEPIPPHLRGLAPGYHALSRKFGDKLVFVSDSVHGRLYLTFNQEHVNLLAFFYGFLPLTVVLLIIYLSTWLTYRLSKRAVSPVVWLANEVRALDPKAPDVQALNPDRVPPDVDGEVQVLAEALYAFAERNREFLERERTFTRDASHELRSPLTVIKIATDVLLAEEDLEKHQERSVTRIKRACKEMEALIEAFLILAREADRGLPEELFVVNQVVAEELDRAEMLLGDKPVELKLIEQAQFSVRAAPKVVGIMVANLIRNACSYTDKGRVAVTVGGDFIEVADTGVGMSEDDLENVFKAFFRAKGAPRGGHGVGLTIVKRLSDRFNWPVDIESKLGVGTTVRIAFPDAQPV
jgi:signal transduction histidine kinase